MPIVQPDKKSPETPSKREYVNDFSGGLNTTISGSLLNKNEAQIATNVSFEQKGTIAPQKGRRKRYTEPFNDEAITGLGMLFKQDGTSHLVATSEDKVYSDAPRMSYKYSEKGEWETGTMNSYANLERSQGDVIVDAGTLGMLHDTVALTGFSPFSSTAGNTYGWKFKVSRPMKAFKIKWIPLIAGVDYKLVLWEGWLNFGSSTNTRLVEITQNVSPDKINTVQTIELTGTTYDPILLQANKEYVLSLYCATANSVSRYVASGLTKPDYMTYVSSATVAGDLYPTSDTTGSATYYGITAMLEYQNAEITVDSKSEFEAQGTLTDLEYTDADVLTLTHAIGSVSCSTLTNRLDRVEFSSFAIDDGVYNFTKTTTTNSDNKTGYLYPYASNFKITAFPTSTSYYSNTELANADYTNIKADSNGTNNFNTGTTAGYFSGLRMRFYVPLDVYDRDKITSLNFVFNVAPIDATTKMLVYALPAGGVELGTGNTQVLVGTFDPNVFRPYNLLITADPKRFVNATTGQIQLTLVPDVTAKAFAIYGAKMVDTFTKKSVESLRALLSVPYTVNYGDSQTEAKTVSYMSANFGMPKFDKARTTITIGAQSASYSKAILPTLKVCGKSGMELLRLTAPSNTYVEQSGTTGTLENLVTESQTYTASNYKVFSKGTTNPTNSAGVLALVSGTPTVSKTWSVPSVGIAFRNTASTISGTTCYLSSTVDMANSTAWEFNGWMTPPTSGTYTFTTANDDNVLVYINNTLVVEYHDSNFTVNSTFEAITAPTRTPITLTANVIVPVRIIVCDGIGDYGLALGWKKPGDSTFSVVPGSYFTNPSYSFVKLARQGADLTTSLVKTTGTHTQTVYNTSADAITLAVDPAEQGMVGLPGWDYAKKITIPANTVTEALTNFPLTVYLNSSNFDFSKCKPDGTDIRFTDTALNPLKFERVEHTAASVLAFNGASFINQGSPSSLGLTNSNYKFVIKFIGTGNLGLGTLSGASGRYLFIESTGQVVMKYAGGTVASSLYTKPNVLNTLTLTRDTITLNGVQQTVAFGNLWQSLSNPLYVGSAYDGYNGLTYGGYFSGGIISLLLYNTSDQLIRTIVNESTQAYTGTPTGSLTIAPPLAKYTVNVPAVATTTPTEILMHYGNANAYNVSCEAWQDQTGNGWAYNGNAKIRPNMGLALDGSGDYLSVAHSESLTVTTDSMCIEATIRLDANNISHTIIAKGGIGNVSYPNYALGISTSGKLVCGIGFTKTASPSLSDWDSLTGTTTLQANTTYHVCMTRVGSTLKLYINGVLDGTKTDATVSPNDANSRVVTIGIANGGAADPYKGSLLGLRFTKGRARYTANFTPPTSFEIDGSDVAFCTNFDTVYDPNYAMVQHMGTHLIDASGNGKNGTATGTTVVDTVYGKARSFNGTSDYINMLTLSTGTTYTLTAMFKQDQSVAGNGYYYFGQNSNASGTFNGFHLIRVPSGNLSLDFKNASASVGNLGQTAGGKTDLLAVSAVITPNATVPHYLSSDALARVSLTPSGSYTMAATQVRFGKHPDAYWQVFNGTLNTMRISSVGRVHSWTLLEHLALKNSVLTIEDATFEKFYATGSYEAPPMDFTAVVAPEIGTETLAKTITVPTGTTASLEYRTSTNGSVWSAYAALPDTPIAWAPYVQVKATLNANVDKTATPEFAGVTMGFKTGYYAEGYWTSDVLTLAMQGLLADSIAYVIGDTPAGTSCDFQIRTSADNVTWTDWSTITPGTDLPSVNYLQYRVKLNANTALTNTPVHKKSYVGYTAGFKGSGSWVSQVYDMTSYEPTTIEWLYSNLFADLIATNPTTTVTSWIKTSYNNSDWSAWQKFDFNNKDWSYDDLAMNPYVQFKIDFASSNVMQTPVLDGFTFREADDMKIALWTSPVIDVSKAKNLDSGKVIAQYTNGGGTLSIMTRTSANGIDNWSKWQTVDASFSVVSPANNFIQIKAFFYGYESALKELVLSMDGNSSVKLIGSGLSLGAEYSFTTLRDKLFIANGKEPLKKWDGNTELIQPVAGTPPTLKYLISHHNRVWGVDAENQSRVRYSNILEPETWGAFDFIDFNPEDGDYITNILKYGQNVVISKQRSMALLTGNKTTNYNVSWLEAEQGCSSARGMCQADKYVVYVSQDGIRFTDLANSIVATERIVPNWDRINKRRLAQSAVVYWRNKVFVALPKDDSLVNNVVWVYDFLRNSWSIREGWSVSTWLKFNQYGEDVLMAGSSETGQIYQVDVTDYDDDIPVEYIWKSKDFHFNMPERYKLFRNIFLDIAGTSDATTLNVDLIVDGVITGTYTTTIPAGKGVKHTRRILPPLYGAVLGSAIAIQLRGRCGVQGITIEYVARGAIPGENL